jgi:outer membrane protein TolC
MLATWDSAGQSQVQAGEVSLDQVVAEALQNNPELQAATREQEAAQQRIAPAGALDDPMLEAGFLNLPTGSFRFNRDDMTMKMIGFSQRLPYPGKRELRQGVATKEAEASAYGLQELINRVRRDVKIAYLDLSLVVESTRITETNKQVLDQLSKIAEARYSVGQASQADVLKAQTQVSKMTDELIKLDRDRRMFEAELHRLMGSPSNPLTPRPREPQLWEGSLQPELLREAVLTSRPELRALQTKIDRNDKAVELARKDYYPDFDVRLSYGQRDRTPTGERREDMVTLTVAINLPIWRAAKQGPRVAESIAMREQAARMFEARRNEMLSQLRQQLASAAQSYQSAKLYETTVLTQSRLAAESSLASYRVNRVDFLTLLDNRMTVFNYEINYATAVVNQNKALAEIEFITGKPIS